LKSENREDGVCLHNLESRVYRFRVMRKSSFIRAGKEKRSSGRRFYFFLTINYGVSRGLGAVGTIGPGALCWQVTLLPAAAL